MEKKKKTTQVKKTSTKKNTTKVQTKKTNTKKSKKAFTLIELLAVIIILGVLMIIAIPSVTRYIQDSRKNAYITTAHNFIDSARVMANSGELSMYDPNTTYYIPKDCISLEKGGDSPFGEFTDAYVVVTYNGKGYDYYWTSNDVTHNGIYLTYEGLLDVDSVMSDVEGISPNIGVGDRENIIVFDEGTCNTVKTESTASDYVEEQGKITELGIDYENADYNNYLKTTSNFATIYFGYSLDKSKIEKITIKKSKTVPSDAVALGSIPATGADVSNKKNGSIMMWVTDKDNNGMYELFIGQDGGVVANSDSSYLFYEFRNAASIDVSYLNTKNVNVTSYMFGNAGYNMTSFEIKGLSKINTSNIKKMSYMFDYTGYNVENFDVDLSKWDVSNVTSMFGMFTGCGYASKSWSVGDLSKWNVSNVTTMKIMFANSGRNAKKWFVGDLSKWNVSKVTDMFNMFTYAGYNATTWSIGNLSNWNVSNVTDMYGVFNYAGYNATTWSIGDLSNWDTSKVTDMGDMFNYAGQNDKKWSVGDLSNWNVSNVKYMGWMFCGSGKNAIEWNVGDLSGWDTSKVTDMRGLFMKAGLNATKKVNPNVSGWNVSSVSSFSYYSGFNENATWITPPTWVN